MRPRGRRGKLRANHGQQLTSPFEQAGAENRGTFKQFRNRTQLTTRKNLAASIRSSVKVQIASLDNQDNDRDTTLASAELFRHAEVSRCNYAATRLVREANGLVALGKLTCGRHQGSARAASRAHHAKGLEVERRSHDQTPRTTALARANGNPPSSVGVRGNCNTR